MTIDVADLVNSDLKQMDRKSFTGERFHQIIEDIVLNEMSSAEIVESDRLAKLSEYQKAAMAHSSYLVEKNGQYVQSTFESKVMAIHLAARLPEPAQRQAVFNQLSRSYEAGHIEESTLATLNLIAKNLIH